MDVLTVEEYLEWLYLRRVRMEGDDKDKTGSLRDFMMAAGGKINKKLISKEEYARRQAARAKKV